jgi:hypothetical protein
VCLCVVKHDKKKIWGQNLKGKKMAHLRKNATGIAAGGGVDDSRHTSTSTTNNSSMDGAMQSSNVRAKSPPQSSSSSSSSPTNYYATDDNVSYEHDWEDVDDEDEMDDVLDDEGSSVGDGTADFLPALAVLGVLCLGLFFWFEVARVCGTGTDCGRSRAAALAALRKHGGAEPSSIAEAAAAAAAGTHGTPSAAGVMLPGATSVAAAAAASGDDAAHHISVSPQEWLKLLTDGRDAAKDAGIPPQVAQLMSRAMSDSESAAMVAARTAMLLNETGAVPLKHAVVDGNKVPQSGSALDALLSSHNNKVAAAAIAKHLTPKLHARVLAIVDALKKDNVLDKTAAAYLRKMLDTKVAAAAVQQAAQNQAKQEQSQQEQQQQQQQQQQQPPQPSQPQEHDDKSKSSPPPSPSSKTDDKKATAKKAADTKSDNSEKAEPNTAGSANANVKPKAVAKPATQQPAKKSS